MHSRSSDVIKYLNFPLARSAMSSSNQLLEASHMHRDNDIYYLCMCAHVHMHAYVYTQVFISHE